MAKLERSIIIHAPVEKVFGYIKKNVSMNWKLLAKFAFASGLLVAVAFCLLLPLRNINAGSPAPTPSSTLNIITKLQSSRTVNAKPNQFDSRIFKQAPSPSEREESPASTVDQQTFDAIADATVLEGYPALNLGDTIDMWAGYDEYLDPPGRIARSLVKFDIAGLPPDQIIAKATLKVYLVNSWDYPDTSRTIKTYRITSNWLEDNVNWNNRPGYGSAYGSNSIVHEAWGWYEFDMTELVAAWYDGTYSNHGIMLRGPEISGSDSSWRGFGTRESEYTPQLIIDLTSSTSTPTATQTPTPTTTQTSTPTPTVTSSPTPTQTLPPSGSSYLPLVRKYVQPPTPTPTPTPTQTQVTPIPPSKCPRVGHWQGKSYPTSPVFKTDISLSVSNAPECRVESMEITVYCPDVYLISDTLGPEAIIDNHFEADIHNSFSGDLINIVGDFTSEIEVSGTWFDTQKCQGTWEASFSSP
jgi:hypothetical protein